MSWERLPKPDGVGDIKPTEHGFETAISIPLDEDGFFGRECPSCEAPFKMRHDEYQALPDELELTCPYCGHKEEHSAFMSTAQRERVMAAAQGMASGTPSRSYAAASNVSIPRRAAASRRSPEASGPSARGGAARAIRARRSAPPGSKGPQTDPIPRSRAWATRGGLQGQGASLHRA